MIGHNLASVIRHNNGNDVGGARIDKSRDARPHRPNIADISFLNLAFNTLRPDTVWAGHMVKDAGVPFGPGARREPFLTPFVFQAQVIIRIFLFGGDISG